jgi:biotin carboxyl carrier protein
MVMSERKDNIQAKKRQEAVERIQSGTMKTRRHGNSEAVTPNYTARRAAALLLAAGSVIVGGKAIASVGDSTPIESPTPTTLVVVRPGDSIWSLQREEATGSGLHPDADIRDEVYDAVKINDGTNIQPGQVVSIIEIEDKPGSQQAIAKQSIQP